MNDSVNDRKRRGRYLLEYTVLFAAVSLIVFAPFLLSGKSLVGKGDGQSQYILQLEYMGRYLREWLSGIFRGDFIPRRYDFTIGMGDDISSVVRFHPLDFLSVFVPSAHTEALYHVLIFLRLYLAGIAFSAFISAFRQDFGKEGIRCRMSRWGMLAGCMVYLFNGYTFSLGIVHPIYLSPLITLPLLLYGAERIMNQPKLCRFGLFTAMTALGFISNYYFMYIESIALVFYVFVRFFQINAAKTGAEKGKAFLSLFLRMAVSYAAGLMISAITLFPTLSRYLSSYRSERISEVHNLLVYADKRRYLAWIVNLISPLRASGNGTHLNYAVIAVPALVLLFAVRKAGTGKDLRGTRQLLRICSIACLVCLLIPAGGYVMAVMNNENNRWVFLIACLLGAAVSFEWEDLLNLDGTRRKVLTGAALFFDLMVLVEIVIVGYDLYNVTAGVELTLFTAAMVLVSIKRNEKMELLLMAAVILSTAINGIMTFGRPFGNLVRFYMDRGTSLQTYEQSVYSVYGRIEDDSFYRTDGVFRGNTEDNAALYLGYPGVQMYNSVLNRDEIRALLETGNPGLTTMLHIHNLDGHTAMSALSSVKYFLADEKNTASVPIGYAPDSVYTKDGYSLYENLYPAGLTFFVNEVLPETEAGKLNPVEREYAMLYAAIVPDDRIPVGILPVSAEKIREQMGIRTERMELPDPADGIERTGSGYAIRDTGSALTLDVPMKKGQEYFLFFDGLTVEQAQKMMVRSEGIVKSVTLLDDQASYTMGRNTYAVRLGCCGRDETRQVRLRFTQKGKIGLDSVSLISVDEETVTGRLKELHRDGCQVEAGKDRLRIRYSCDQDGVQVFAIPFSNGWTACSEDGTEDLFCADLCFLGVFSGKGDHEIWLTYHGPGVKMGVWTAAAGILLCLILLLIRRAWLRTRPSQVRAKAPFARHHLNIAKE